MGSICLPIENPPSGGLCTTIGATGHSVICTCPVIYRLGPVTAPARGRSGNRGYFDPAPGPIVDPGALWEADFRSAMLKTIIERKHDENAR